MKEKYIFSGIVIIAIIAIGAVMYRSVYRADEPTMQTQHGQTPVRQDEYVVPVSAPSVTPPTTQPGVPSKTTPATEPTIVYTVNGFAPAPLIISAGQAVTFKNNGTADMWVASAPHPTHTDYPGFDAMRPYGPGESYSFTFTRIGTWKYHNHLNPQHFGSIVVTE